MRVFIDTAVLIPVFYGDHVHHGASLEAFTRFGQSEAACGAHSLVEVYSALTRMPDKHRIRGDPAPLFLDDLRGRLTVVGLTPGEYFSMLHANAGLEIVSGAIYDALLAAWAIKSGAATLLTWNLRHYLQLGLPLAPLVQTPLNFF